MLARRGIPQQINGAEQGACAFCGAEQNTSAFRFLFDHAHLVQTSSMLTGRGQRDFAQVGNVLEAKVGLLPQQTDDLDATVDLYFMADVALMSRQGDNDERAL